MRDSAGNVVKWLGVSTDIEDQRHTQEVLEEQIKKHTAALMEANSRLETEMRERTLAQQELNQQNERMLTELTRRSRRAILLAKMAELLQSCAELKDVFSIVAGMAPKVFPEFGGAVLLLNSSRKMLEVAAQWSKCQLIATVFHPQDCWALRTGHLHFVAGGDRTAVCAHSPAGKNSYFCVPLQSQGEAVGILHFQSPQGGELTESELSFASTFAEQVGLSIANLRLREALRNQSIRDPLTMLYNRRYLEELMERETRTRRPGRARPGRADARSRSLQELQRHVRARCRRHRFARVCLIPHAQRARRRHRVPLRRRGIRRRSAHGRSQSLVSARGTNLRQAPGVAGAASRPLSGKGHRLSGGGCAARERHFAQGSD